MSVQSISGTAVSGRKPINSFSVYSDLFHRQNVRIILYAGAYLYAGALRVFFSLSLAEVDCTLHRLFSVLTVPLKMKQTHKGIGFAIERARISWSIPTRWEPLLPGVARERSGRIQEFEDITLSSQFPHSSS
jgi:hypothetical protein